MFSSAPILTCVKYTNCSLVLIDSTFYDQISLLLFTNHLVVIFMLIVIKISFYFWPCFHNSIHCMYRGEIEMSIINSQPSEAPVATASNQQSTSTFNAHNKIMLLVLKQCFSPFCYQYLKTWELLSWCDFLALGTGKFWNEQWQSKTQDKRGRKKWKMSRADMELWEGAKSHLPPSFLINLIINPNPSLTPLTPIYCMCL